MSALFDDQYNEDPDFIFNKLNTARQTILITGDNFKVLSNTQPGLFS